MRLVKLFVTLLSVLIFAAPGVAGKKVYKDQNPFVAEGKSADQINYEKLALSCRLLEIDPNLAIGDPNLTKGCQLEAYVDIKWIGVNNLTYREEFEESGLESNTAWVNTSADAPLNQETLGKQRKSTGASVD